MVEKSYPRISGRLTEDFICAREAIIVLEREHAFSGLILYDVNTQPRDFSFKSNRI